MNIKGFIVLLISYSLNLVYQKNEGLRKRGLFYATERESHFFGTIHHKTLEEGGRDFLVKFAI